MRTVTQIKTKLEKTNSRIKQLKDLNVSQAAEMSSLEAAKIEMETELASAPGSEPSAANYINSHYKRPDKQ
jgi:hypothetical protein